MAEVSLAAVLAVVVGFVLGHNHCWVRYCRTDVIGEGVRKQMASVREKRRWIGSADDWCVTSQAEVITADGNFEIMVREKIGTPTHD